MRHDYWVAALTLLGVTAPAMAQQVTVGGQVRPRFEFREPAGDGDDSFTSMRVRAQVSADLERNVRVFIQLQDVRLFGEEANTLTDFRADNFDLHQGYVELRAGPEAVYRGRVGRQELVLGGQRLIGAVGWAQQGRAFDGVRLGVDGAFGSVVVFGMQLAEATDPDIADDAELAGAYVQFDRVAGGRLDVYGIYNHASGTPRTSQTTFGARLTGSQWGFTYRAEASYQLGERGAQDVAAFMIGARVGASLAGGAGTVTLWYDYLSGDDDPTDGDVNVFDTLFATNHKFYGFADLFLDIPAHTNGLGLQDIAVKGSYRVSDDLSLNADIHSFHLAKAIAPDSRHLGEEIDLTANYRYSRNLAITAGISYVTAGSAFEAIGRLTEDMTWAYVMLNATL